ncbi:MAG: hypothetical protein IT269_03940 [Saprospiraceae bacterium]|nr:hypothetical protein [Saprospiraceae bacterium]
MPGNWICAEHALDIAQKTGGICGKTPGIVILDAQKCRYSNMAFHEKYLFAKNIKVLQQNRPGKS